jgi:hypothetical protein
VITFPDTHLTDEAIAIIDKAVATAAAELGTHMAEWLGKAALTPRQLLLLNPDKVFPPDQWCYEVQYRIMTGRPFNDGWSDWQAIPRYPSRFSTPRRAANRQRKVEANDRGFIPTQYRIEPVFLGRVPDFKWERSQRNKPKNVTLTDHETRKRTAMRTATGSNLLLGGSYHIGEQKTK